MNKLSKIFLAFALLITLSSYVLNVKFNSETEEKNQILLTMVMNYLENVHYQPEDLNDSFSADAFDLYLKRLDYNKRLFLQADVDILNAYRTEIDDEIQSGSFELYEKANTILDARMNLVEGFYEEILADPFDFSIAESVEEDAEKTRV